MPSQCFSVCFFHSRNLPPRGTHCPGLVEGGTGDTAGLVHRLGTAGVGGTTGWARLGTAGVEGSTGGTAGLFHWLSTAGVGGACGHVKGGGTHRIPSLLTTTMQSPCTSQLSQGSLSLNSRICQVVLFPAYSAAFSNMGSWDLHPALRRIHCFCSMTARSIRRFVTLDISHISHVGL